MSKGPDNLARTVLTDPVHFLAFGFGTGLAPFAPGTFGSIPGVILFWLTLDLGLYVQLGIAGVMAIIGIWICGESARRIGVHDHGGIVWDEFVGYWITMFMLPFSWGWILAGFALFRLLDIWKPWPIGWFDKHVDGGLGIMLDDVIAGVLACMVLHTVRVAAGL